MLLCRRPAIYPDEDAFLEKATMKIGIGEGIVDGGAAAVRTRYGPMQPSRSPISKNFIP